MSHEHGAYLGSIRTVEDLRQRCVIGGDSDCWHLRTANGRAMPSDKRHGLWLHGHGRCTATRGAWLLEHGKFPQHGSVVYRTCGSYDCVKPAHLMSSRRKVAIRHFFSAGHFDSPARKTAVAKFTASRPAAVITQEMRGWLNDSSQSGVDVAHALGCSQSCANVLRRQMRGRPSSVWALGLMSGKA